MTDAPPSPAGGAAPRAPFAARLRDGLADSIRFFTRAPVPAGWTAGERAFDGIAGFSPVAGALIGLFAGLALTIALVAGLPPAPTAVVAAATAVLLSGGLHLDGLADVADGFGGGATVERKLEIMRDSRLGSYGAAALALALIARVTLVAALVERLGAGDAVLALVAAGALSRPLAFLPTLLLEPARADGLGRAGRPGRRAALGGLAIGGAVALICGGLAMGLAGFALGLAAAAAVAAAARRQIGGYTGDVCGAAAEIAEIAALAGLLAASA